MVQTLSARASSKGVSGCSPNRARPSNTKVTSEALKSPTLSLALLNSASRIPDFSKAATRMGSKLQVPHSSSASA